jgi:23S rRNA pseudouridine2605 synthase
MKYQKKDRRDDERRPRKATSERSNSERTSSSRSRSSNENTERPLRSSSPRDKFGKDERAPRVRRDDSSSKPYRDNSERPSNRRSSDFNDRPKRSSSDFNERPKRSGSDFNDRPKRSSSDFNDRPKRSGSDFNDRPKTSNSDFNDRPKTRSNSEFSDRPKRSNSDFNDRPKRTSYKENAERSSRRTSSDFNDKPRERRSGSDFNDRPKRSNSDFNDRPKRAYKDNSERPTSNRSSEFTDKPIERKSKSDSTDRAKRFNSEKTKRSTRSSSDDSSEKKNSKNLNTSFSKNSEDDLIRLNRYISNSGVCSRRKADELILNGEVTVNAEVVKELGYKVKITDKIKFQGKLLKPGNLEYILLNKPKDFITTTDDPLERKTVMDLVRNASDERVYPVGRLDRNTTGLLLFTNDGDLADRLAHPRNQVRKIYEVELDKSLSTSDFEKIKEGLELEDGLAKVDAISYLDGKAKKHVGVEIHIGRNRIVRRIFESIGYEVIKLDRVVYAGLTKKDLPRGRFRHLTKEEVIYLKHLNKY